MGPEASVYVYNQGKEDYAVNFAQLTQRDGSFLMGRENAENFDFSMLKGKTIIGEEGGYIPYTCYSAKKSYIEKNPEIIQAFTNGIYKGMKWVESHSTEEIAKSLQPHFPDADLEVLTALVERYRAQDTWKPDLILTEDGLNHMMDIIDQAIGLDNRAPYEKIVTSEFAEKAMKK